MGLLRFAVQYYGADMSAVFCAVDVTFIDHNICGWWNQAFSVWRGIAGVQIILNKWNESFFVAEEAATFRVIKKAYNRSGLKFGLLMISFFYVVWN